MRPTVSEELKHGYIQYVAFLVLTALLGEDKRVSSEGVWLASLLQLKYEHSFAARTTLFVLQHGCSGR